MKPIIEFATHHDLDTLFGLFAKHYRFNPRLQERDFFDWQFSGAPVRLGDGEYDFLVARDSKGDIIGWLGIVGFEFCVNGEIRTGGWTHNWLAEGGGGAGLALFSRYLELVDNRILIRLNETSSEIARLYRMPILTAIPRWWAVVDAEQALSIFRIENDNDRALMRASAAKLARLDAREQLPVIGRLANEDEFHFTHLPGIAGYTRKTGRYLNWRYVDIPHHDYRIIRGKHGFGVYRVEKIMHTEASAIRLIEWTFDGSEADAALVSILEQTRQDAPVLLDFHCTHSALTAPLKPLGFEPVTALARPLPDLFRPLHHSGGYAVAIDLPPHRTVRNLDFESWYITIGDSDVDRKKL